MSMPDAPLYERVAFIGLGLIATLLPAGDPNRGVVSLAMLLGTLIALVGIVKLLRQR